MEFDFSLITRFLPLLGKGTWMTLQLLFSAASLSLSVGLLCGTATCQVLKKPIISSCIEALCFVFRSVPFYVQLLIFYFVVPELLHFSIEPFAAAALSLGLCSAAYTSQIVRGGLNAVPKAQWESAFSLGYSRIQALLFVIFPQMWRMILPAINNEAEALLKSTSIASAIGLLELTRVGMNIVSREMQPIPVYLIIALFYLGLSAIMNVVARIIEKRIRYANS